MTTKHNNIHSALSAAMGSISPMVHDRQRKDVKTYSYVSANALKAAAQAAFAANGIAISCPHLSYAREGNDILVTCTWQFSHASGELTAQSVGAAQLLTKNGAIQPEAIASAQTRSLVSALRSCLLIPEAEDAGAARNYETQQQAISDPAKAEAEKRQAQIKLALAKLSRRRDCPYRDAIAEYKEALAEGDADTLREAYAAANDGDWSLIRAELEAAGAELEDAEDAEEDPPKPKPKTKPEPEPESVPGFGDGEEDSAEEWTLPKSRPSKNASNANRIAWWLQVLKSHPDFDSLHHPEGGWEEWSGRDDVKEKIRVVGLQTMCEALAEGKDSADAIRAVKAAITQAAK